VRDLDDLFDALSRSTFRSRFKLRPRERNYLTERGLPTILNHAADFVASRLAPAQPTNDGRQTPMANHPVFVAQHATATCCRGCLEKWHGIPSGRELDQSERDYVVEAICRWIEADIAAGAR